jgi:internalin A
VSFRTKDGIKRLFLHGNPGLFISAEVLGPTLVEMRQDKKEPANPQSILDYYFGIMAGARPLNEVKLLLVGRGKAGKSCLKDALFDRPFDPNKKETPGIDIEVSPGRLEAADGDVTVHVWDFAGQTITHATHQFFLTERSVYLLVIEGRMNTQNQDAEYWLKLISGFGKDSPVIICLNKYDEFAFSVNEVALRAKYPAIRAILQTDCLTRRGLEDLDREIHAAIDSIPEVRQKFPLAWWEAKERFSRMTADYLSLDAFRQECSAHGEADAALQLSLAQILHRLGILLHFSGDDDLKEIAVLNPHWVTQNIYRLLRLKQGPESDGTLTQAEAAAALDGAKEEEVAYLLGLMRKFELCFPVTGRPDVLLVPDLLPENPVQDLGDWRSERRDLLRLRYEYTVLPEGLIPRFITRTYPLSQNQPRWRYGVVLETDGGRALVLADGAEQRIDVAISGDVAAQERIAKVIRHHFAQLNVQFGGLEPTEWIEVREFPGKYQRVDALLKDEQRGKPSMIITEEGTEIINQKAELDRISSETSRKEEGKRLKVFISYAHADTDMFDLFRSRNLAVMESDKLISSWTDRRIQLGQKWDEAIKAELESCDVMLCLISTPFFASEYIRGVEMKRALERQKEGKLRIVSVLLEDCPAWDRSELSVLQAIIPEGQPVRFNDRRPADAFNVVERKLVEMIGAM